MAKVTVLAPEHPVVRIELNQEEAEQLRVLLGCTCGVELQDVFDGLSGFDNGRWTFDGANLARTNG